MRVSIVLDAPDDLARECFRDENVELELRNYRTGFMLRFRKPEFVLVAGDSAVESIALAIVAKLKAWSGEPPIDPSQLDLTR